MPLNKVVAPDVVRCLRAQPHAGSIVQPQTTPRRLLGPGTGKTHLATALSVSGVTQHSKKVRFYSTVDLVNALEHEKLMGKPGRIALSLSRLDLVVLDELGYLPFSQVGGALGTVAEQEPEPF